jgi:uncharacterized protein YbjT (DUF2867 family)
MAGVASRSLAQPGLSPAAADRRSILVIGGTRGTGLAIVELLRRSNVRVCVLARNPAAAAALLGPGVQVIAGDITRAETLGPAVDRASHVVFTAGVRSGRPARESLIKATEYQGVLNTLAAARSTRFEGRFLYMTASGLTIRSLSTIFLNLYKGNTLVWRRRAEAEIRASGLDYTIVRAGFLLNRPGGQHAVVVRQDSLPLAFRYRIARADVAEAFVAALDHPRASRATFEVVWGRGRRDENWKELLDRVRPDA